MFGYIAAMLAASGIIVIILLSERKKHAPGIYFRVGELVKRIDDDGKIYHIVDKDDFEIIAEELNNPSRKKIFFPEELEYVNKAKT